MCNKFIDAFNVTYKCPPFLISFVFHLSSYYNICSLMIMQFQKCPVTLSTNKLFPFRTSRPNRADILMSTKSKSRDMSYAYLRVGKKSSTIPFDLINVFPNWKSLCDSITRIALRHME